MINTTRFAPSELPLEAVPHASSFSLAAPQREALAALRAGLADDYPFLLLTGDAGTGKTTVARGLLERLDPDRYALGGMFGPYGAGDALMTHTVQDFAVRMPRPGERFLTLEDFLRQCTSGREAVLVIDEAQAMDSMALRQLWHLVVPQADRRPLLRVVLVCVQVPAAVDELVRDSELLPIGARIHLRRLRHAETRDLVLHRLRSRGGTGLPAFNADALIAIHERSAGVMRRASLLCDRILMWLELEGARDVSAQVVNAVDTQVRGEWSGLKSEETAARIGEARPAAPAGSSQLTPVDMDTPVSTARTTSTSTPRAPPSDARLDSVPSPNHELSPPSASAHPHNPGLAPPSGALSLAQTEIQADPKAAGPVAGPPLTAAGNAKARHRPSAVPRQGRMPKLVAGLLLLGVAVLVGLAMQWGLREPAQTRGSDRAVTGSTVYVPGESLPPPVQQPVTTPPPPPPAAPPAALPAALPPSWLASSPPPAEAAAPRAAVESIPPTPSSTVCSGTAEALGLCAEAAPARPKATASPTTDAAPISARPACAAERAALGLCDTP